ncbi:hypothetical protein BpHYR1_000620 [Brachionus plicatilis]|uniref:Uncharacterized protein n=1 Tax=Brachionus plicatilis TaxID=10195 RepID=A0A3M7R6T0_BRAPC|nr:hypothetical protein BpHYR1_000620 [Brachionus plicatilis]
MFVVRKIINYYKNIDVIGESIQRGVFLEPSLLILLYILIHSSLKPDLDLASIGKKKKIFSNQKN